MSSNGHGGFHLTRRGIVRLVGAAGVAAAAGGVLAACSSSSDEPDAGTSGAGGGGEQAASDPVQIVTNVEGTEPFPVDHVVRVEAQGGALDTVVVRTADGTELAGDLLEGGATWVASALLEPDTSYAVTASAGEQTAEVTFSTVALTLAEQTFASVAPLAGEVVGVGMPVVVAFDLPVTDRASFERHMTVTSEPAQEGSWHWYSDTEVRWRPAAYWEPGTTVTVDLAVNSVPAGGGIYGQESRQVAFEVGSSVIHRIDVAAHQMVSSIDGQVVRTMPVSGGKPGYETRSGIKVVMEKFRTKTMDAATTGVSPGDPEYYNISDVEYALRLTNSGEFIHAAPWSIGSQGSANVSHGCVGMSTQDAGWVFENSKRGDVVEVTGTDRQMTLENGYGDWNATPAVYAEASAL